MESVQEALGESHKRKALLGGCLLSELATIVVSYAVTDHQLFEESLLRRNFLRRPGSRNQLLAELEMAGHVLTKYYLAELLQIDMSRWHFDPDPRERMRHVMLLGDGGSCCCRLRCFYNMGLCNCTRPMIADQIIAQTSLIMYF